MREFLATEMGFTIFSIAVNMPEAYRLNDYVLHGNGDPAVFCLWIKLPQRGARRNPGWQ
jgi:erythromycin esterase-like protein